MTTRVRRITLLLLTLAGTILLDQSTKFLAKQMLSPGEVVHVVGNFFVLTPAENDGAFLSMFSGLGPGFKILLMIVLPVVAMAGALIYAVKPGLSLGVLTGLGFIVAGGISNLYDRILHNMFVFDFMNMGIGGLRTGIFNIADMAIMLGIGLILIGDSIFRKKQGEHP